MGSQIKHLTTIIGPDTGIYSYVHHEEGNQENPGKGHDKLFADR
jgi:hypothetical protein